MKITKKFVILASIIAILLIGGGVFGKIGYDNYKKQAKELQELRNKQSLEDKQVDAKKEAIRQLYITNLSREPSVEETEGWISKNTDIASIDSAIKESDEYKEKHPADKIENNTQQTSPQSKSDTEAQRLKSLVDIAYQKLQSAQQSSQLEEQRNQGMQQEYNACESSGSSYCLMPYLSNDARVKEIEAQKEYDKTVANYQSYLAKSLFNNSSLPTFLPLNYS